MKESILEFVERFDNFYSLEKNIQIDLFSFFLEEQGVDSYSSKEIKSCFELTRTEPYSNISSYLSKNIKASRGKKAKYLKLKTGFHLSSAYKIVLKDFIPNNKPKAQTSKSLRDLLKTISNPEQNVFLDEAIKCFEIGAFRASIIMTWNLTMDHIFEFILSKNITEFNTVLDANIDRRIRINAVVNKDDFSEIPEGKFIEFCRQSRIISNDVRKILETKLGTRNTYAHPSNVIIVESKAIEFIEDLINNVILKYNR